MSVIVSEAFLMRWSTSKACGAWTNAQFRVLGLGDNPPSGWKDRVLGTRISDKKAKQFALARDITWKHRPKRSKLLEKNSIGSLIAEGLEEIATSLKGRHQDLTAIRPLPRGVILWGHCAGESICEQSDESLDGATWAARSGVGDEEYLRELCLEADRRIMGMNHV